MKILFLACLLIVNIGADQITKYAASKNLRGKGSVQVAGNVLILRYAENEGAFLSLGSKLPERVKTVLLIFLPGLIIIGGTVYLAAGIKKMRRLQLAALGCLIGGGISNLYDRIVYKGSVIDFMNIGIGRLRTGIFNLADISILLGGILLVIAFIREEGKPKRGDAEIT